MLQKLLLVAILLLFIPVTAQSATLKGRVTWIYDGDTIKVENIGKVRLIGIDTPETKASSRDRFYTKKYPIKAKKLRQIARQVKKYNIRWVKGKTVKLKLDRTKKDKYGRLLAYVYLPSGDMLNLVLVEKGFASVFRRYDFRHKKKFLKAEKKAQKRKSGLWGK